MKKSQKRLGLRLDVSTIRPLVAESFERVQGGWFPTSFTVCGTTLETNGCVTDGCPPRRR